MAGYQVEVKGERPGKFVNRIWDSLIDASVFAEEMQRVANRLSRYEYLQVIGPEGVEYETKYEYNRNA